MAQFEFYHGVMGSGKGAFVAQMVHNTKRRNIHPVTMKPGTDTKAGDSIVSRIGTSVPVDIMAAQKNNEHAETDVRKSTLEHLGLHAIVRCHLIVDEVQFFSPRQIEQLYDLAKIDDIPVTCFGLKTDVYRRLFSGSQRLLELAKDYELQTAIRCAGCANRPEHNGRYINGLFDIDTEADVVKIDGAADDIVYDVFCTECYDQEVQKSQNGMRVNPIGI
jgi:thymidine kinase